VFSAGHNNKKPFTKATYEQHSSEIDLVHNRIQTDLYEYFCKKLGKDNVETEADSGHGKKIDIVVRDKDDNYIFYEIKRSYSVRLCIREALGQLMDYAFYPKEDNAKKLIVVVVSPPKEEDHVVSTYLQQIRDRFSVPIYWQRYDSETKALEDIEH